MRRKTAFSAKKKTKIEKCEQIKGQIEALWQNVG
jgi:hypothetical protein